MNILHIDSSSTGAASISRKLTAAIVDQLRDVDATAPVVYRDLAADAPAHLGSDLIQALRPAPGYVAPESMQDELARTEEMLTEFLAADVVVVGAPMYNFAVPTQLKAWIDRLAQAGRTFRYTAQGPEGLAGGKTVILASSRGGMYAGTPLEVLDHQEAYMKAVFGFFGITDIQVVRAEGVAMGSEGVDKALAAAQVEIGQLNIDVDALAA